jgi:hypothetical protein
MVNTQILHDNSIIASMIDIDSLGRDIEDDKQTIRCLYTGHSIHDIGNVLGHVGWNISFNPINPIGLMWEIHDDVKYYFSKDFIDIALPPDDITLIDDTISLTHTLLSPETELSIQRVCNELKLMSEHKYDWSSDGIEDAENPSMLSFDNMRTILENIIKGLDGQPNNTWMPPFLTDDWDGTLSTEWYYEDRSLHFDIKDNCMTYTKIGKSVRLEDEDGDLNTDNALLLWKWLIDG